MPIKVLIADDHALIREGLTRLLTNDKEIEVVGQADTGYAAVEQAARLNPDVILMDLYMPRMDGITATQLIRKSMPKSCIIY